MSRTPEEVNAFISGLQLRVRRMRTRDNPFRLLYEDMEYAIRSWQGGRITESEMMSRLSANENKACDIMQRILDDV